jgi:hypothetical protein
MFEIFQDKQDITEEDMRNWKCAEGGVLQASWGNSYFYSIFSPPALRNS